MIALAILAPLGYMVTITLEGVLGWAALGRVQDEIAEDARSIWRVMNEDISQSAWYRTEPSGTYAVASLSDDRALFYCPYIVQAAQESSYTQGAPTAANTRLLPFARAGSSDLTYRPPPIFDTFDPILPGTVDDRTANPGTTQALYDGYRESYFARSQELVFVKATSSLWDRRANRPLAATAMTQSYQPPLEIFDGFNSSGQFIRSTRADWLTENNHGRVGALFSSGWELGSGGWSAREQVYPDPEDAPYGRVMESVRFNTTSGNAEFALQFEQYTVPDFQTQDPDNVHLYGYLVVPSPGQRGLGRLVRVKTIPANSALLSGSEVGQVVASTSATSLIVDRVLSDNVVRVLFETSRHACALGAAPADLSQIGSNNIRVTIFFAKLAEHRLAQPTMVHQAITMIFCMRAANTPQDQLDARAEMTRLHFSY